MPLIWAAISGHGYGHAAQVVPVLNALGTFVPDLHVLVRTTVASAFFADRLALPWELAPVQQDVGCMQDGPLTIDTAATWRAHHEFHVTWDDRVHVEAKAMRAARPDLVLADTPYLALAAANDAGIPSVAHVSFTWDLVLAGLPAPEEINTAGLLRSIRQAYGTAGLALRMTPAPPIDVFGRMIDIGPVAEPAGSQRDQLARMLELGSGDITVLVGFGGIPLSSLPFDQLERLTGFCFLFDGPVPEHSRRVRSTHTLPFKFKTLLASVDVIMTKPGYGTIVEAVALGQPVVYVRRYNFADEQTLVDYLHRYGRGVELPREEFISGRWEQALRSAVAAPPPAPPSGLPGGAHDAAIVLAQFFK